MNYPKPKPLNAIIKTPAERAPVYLCVPQYGKKQNIKPSGLAGVKLSIFGDDEAEIIAGSGPGLSNGMKTAIVIGAVVLGGIAAYMIYKKMKSRR